VKRLTWLCFSCVLAVLAPVLCAQKSTRPNIVFILADDLGWSDLNSYGNETLLTPELDALAGGGLRFTDAYAASCVCSPTRSSILSGKYPARNDLTSWVGDVGGYGAAPAAKHLALEEVTIAEALKHAGYATGMVGKWHLGGPRYFPKRQGFDVAIGAPHEGTPEGGYFLPNKLDLPRAKKGDYLTDHLTDEGIRFIEANKDRLFFLYQSYYAVHPPIQGRPDLVAKHRARRKKQGVRMNARYAAMVESLDEGVGRIMAKLEELGLSERTVVFFFSDNGGFSHERGEKNKVTTNLPLRMGKGHLYEGGIREPMIVHYPPLVESGGVCSMPVVSTDFYPTILELAGVDPIPDQHADGMSIVPLLEDPSSKLDREAIYFHHPHRNAQGGAPSGAVRMGDFKLIEFFDDGRLELYNLESDIGETKNLAGAMPDKAKQLQQMLVDWRQRVNAKMPR
jgi:arylsulfatase A-like enzyme